VARERGGANVRAIVDTRFSLLGSRLARDGRARAP
jgi:hypothetical protein